MMNALRLPAGFPEKLFVERTGQPLAAAEPGLSLAIERGLLERGRGEIRPTALGLRFLNDLMGLFLPEPPADAYRSLAPHAFRRRKVSQPGGRRSSRPRRNQRTRCAELPWVKESGVT